MKKRIFVLDHEATDFKVRVYNKGLKECAEQESWDGDWRTIYTALRNSLFVKAKEGEKITKRTLKGLEDQSESSPKEITPPYGYNRTFYACSGYSIPEDIKNFYKFKEMNGSIIIEPKWMFY